MRIIKIVVLLSLVQVPFLFANYTRDIYRSKELYEKRRITHALNTAIYDATVALNEYASIELVEGTPELVIEPKQVINLFLDSLSLQLDGNIQNEELKYMVPFVAIADVDGVFFYELIEEREMLVPKYYHKEAYTREYPMDIRIKYFLNDHIIVYQRGKLVYDGLFFEREDIFPEGFDYEAEKIAATVLQIEERMNEYYSTRINESSTISLSMLAEEDWDNASRDLTIYALVYQMGSKDTRVINNCGVRN